MRLPDGSLAPFGLFIILILIGICSTQRSLKNDANDPTGKSSLAFVFDITGSMFDDLVQVREGAAKIFKTVMAQREKLIYNYIMVPFHDPHLGDIINTTDSTYFMRQLGKVYVHGGGDCPEKTLTGILKALEISLPSSFIYVFTDARSKDYHLEDQVLNTIQEKQSSVVFVMTGDCGNRTHPGFRTYEKIAAASFGQVFHLEKSDVSKVLEYVRHAVKQKKVHMMYEARERGGTTVRTIPVDKHLSELTISLSGDKDDSDVLDITLRDSNGNKVDKQSYSKEGGTIDLKNVKLIRLKDPAPGPWQVITNSRLKHTIRVFGHGAIDFKYGFASRPLDRIELARPRPVLNQNTYLLINMTGLIPPGTVGEISLVDYHGNTLFARAASPHRTNPHMYFVGPFVPPKGLFFVQVTGVDEEDYEFKRIAPTAIGSVVVGGPRAFMAPFHQAFVGTDVNLTCTVESASPFTLYWTRGNGERVGGPLFYQTTDSAVWTLPELSLKDGGEYKCEVISDNGNYTVATRVEPRESPPQIIGARNVSAPIGSAAFLHCPTQSAGPVEIRWIRHGATVFTGPNTERNLNNGTLKIHSVSRSDSGVYECQARNAGGMTSQTIRLDIMEPPQAKVQPERVYFVPRDSINISCYGIGEPKPELHWYFNGRRLISDSRYYIGPESSSLYLRDASHYDEGKYECRAMSPAGIHTDTSEFILAVSPRVELSQSKTMIGRGDSISFECKVLQGKPTPKIRWLRNGKELFIQNDKYIRINEGHLHISGAQDSDAGTYSCVAENMAGKDSGTVDLTIGRMPSIVPSAQTVRVNIERQLTLQCLAIGHPQPEIEWQKEGISLGAVGNDRYTQLADGNLLITDAQVEDQGRFTCIAKNIYGQQSQTTAVIVTGLVSPVLGHVPPEEQLIEGQDLHLSCVVVLGTPRPNIVWLKDGKPVDQSPSLIIEGGGTGLLLRGGDPKDEGKYTCVAVSPAGNATININVQLIKKPEFVNVSDPANKPKVPGIDDSHIAIVNTTHDVLDGDGFAIPCLVFGQPPPTITWYLDGRPIVANRKDFVILPDNTLLVKRADKTFSGTYVCQAANSAGENSQQTTVRIMSKPSISAGQSSFNLVVNEAVNIPCDVFGDPKPKILWYLDDVIFTDGIINEDGSLTIPNLSENHRGTLTCRAENAAGVDSRSVTLTVHTTPHIDVENQEKSVILNETIVLECPAQAHPPPVRIWTYEGEKIDTLLIPHTIRSDGALVLEKMQVEHTGVFTCQVSNLAGEDSLVYTVNVLEKPKIISETPGTIDVVKGLMIEIPCRATGIPEVSRAWQKDGINIGIDSQKFTVDNFGTLRIYNATKSDAGNYNCIVTNQVGSDNTSTIVVVQEPPVILPSTTVNYTSVIGDKLELRCYVDAYPPATIQWLRRGIPIADGTRGITLESDGSLTIEETSLEDATIFTCKASNPAGKAEANLQVTIIAAPDIPDQDTVVLESVRESQPFSLYCPVFSTPLPSITWYVNDKPLTEDLSILNLSDDRRKLHFYHAKVTDSGVYKCVARNAAGEGSKSFQVEVIVPLNLDESEFKKKVFAKEGEEVTLGCPVSGYPTPTINWVIDGRLMQPDEEYKGAKLSPDGRTLHFTEVGIKQEGVYHCVAQSKSGTLDVDVELSVLAIPRLGDDEIIEVVTGKPVMLSCDVLTETDEKTTFVWSMNGSEVFDKTNIQIPMNGQRLYITETTPENKGEYKCRVSNSAGKSEKTIDLKVLEPPVFVEETYNENEQLIPGKPLILSCLARGNPKPTVEWRIDGELVQDSLLLDGEKLRIEKLDSRSAQITCDAKNAAGDISRDFFVQNITPPKIIKGSSGDPTFREGDTIVLDCPVSHGDFEITWMKQGAPINDKEVILTLDKTRLTILNARRDHEDVYTCVANNPAGQVAQDFDVAVHVPPKIAGSAFLQIEADEGTEIALNCDGEGNPKPEILWDFNREPLNANAQLVNENQTVVLKQIKLEDAGVYKCYQINVVGQAVKTINVIVKARPSFLGSDNLIKQNVNITRSTTLECDVNDAVDIDITWTAHGVPLLADTESVQILSGGRYLHIPSARVEDDGTYSCTVTNSAGSASKNFRLHVQVPPTIINDGGEHTVIENNSLVLPCEVDGSPRPVITWTKDGKPLGDLKSVQILSEGQQFKIVHAETRHRGSYVCRAQNDVGTAEINFDVDIITRPSIAKGIKDIVEVVQGETASFKCPVADKNFKGQIIWLYNFQPITFGEDPRLSTSHSDKRLNLQDAKIEDEGPYSCRIRNDAGETKFDFKLQVLVPPKIVMLDKDKNRVVVENSMITLSCPATGKPEPDIKWYKDGEELTIDNIDGIVPSGELNGNELKIMRVKDKDSGKYSCEAINAAGSTDQEIGLNVQTVPRIEKEGIPSVYNSLRGQRVTISCPVFAKPSATVTWLKAGKPLQSDQNVKTSANGQKLYLLKLQKSDSDKYTCVAKNPAGEDKRDFTVNILVAPFFDEPNVVRRILTNAGKPSVLNCPANGSPPPTITWLKDGIGLEENERYVLFDGGRQLQISSTQGDDQGRYTCIATNSEGSDDLENTLDVIVPPVIQGPPHENISVIDGFAAELICDSDHTGMEVEWQRNGQRITPETLRGDSFLQIPSSGKRLSFLSSRKGDSGKYTCIMRNAAGESRKTFDFNVIVPPTIISEMSSETIQTGNPSDTIEINCVVAGTPHPKVTWMFNGKPISNDNREYEFPNDGESIKIHHTNEDNVGKYTCSAENDGGKVEKDFLIRITAPPKFEKENESVELKVGDSIMLACNAESATPVTTTWSVVGTDKNITDVEARIYNITNVQMEDQGTYVCKAVNNAGEVSKNFDLKVIEVPTFYDRQVQFPIVIGRRVTLDCTASGTPEPTILWMKVSLF
ncbi:unnamed protein product [Caenorhabditis angaria]|uniref:Cell adhesion molecule-related/down-regulated by oncogenes n=1 Tax=Caenorhabditis angaria TaxID=860376 RepID=A0A9P1N8D9_9PELO|nr:unnamed protein product [Caenorhabditis angaria]